MIIKSNVKPLKDEIIQCLDKLDTLLGEDELFEHAPQALINVMRYMCYVLRMTIHEIYQPLIVESTLIKEDTTDDLVI